MISRLLHIIGLFCRISSLYRSLLQKRPIILKVLVVCNEYWWFVIFFSVSYFLLFSVSFSTHHYKLPFFFPIPCLVLYGVAPTSRLLKILGLFCKRDLCISCPLSLSFSPLLPPLSVSHSPYAQDEDATAILPTLSHVESLSLSPPPRPHLPPHHYQVQR